MVTKADLHRLIDELPEPALPAAERLLVALEAQGPAFLHDATVVHVDDVLTGPVHLRAAATNGRMQPTKRGVSPAAMRKVRRSRFTTDQPSPEPMTVDEVGERHTNRWILMEVHESDARGAARSGIVLAVGRRRADIQEALFKALREPNMQSQGYYTFRAHRPIPPGPEGLAMIERNQLRSARRDIRRR